MKKQIILPVGLSVLLAVNPMIVFAQPTPPHQLSVPCYRGTEDMMRNDAALDIVKSSENTNSQDRPMTRGDMAVLINQIMNYRNGSAGVRAVRPSLPVRKYLPFFGSRKAGAYNGWGSCHTV